MANTMMKIGGIGCIIWIVAIILSIITVIGLGSVTLSTIGMWAALGLVALIISAIGAILTALGGFGMWKPYKNPLPMIAAIIGIIAGAMYIISLIAGLLDPNLIWTFSLITSILVGVFLLLLGIAFVLVRMKTGIPGLALFAGILCIVAGGMNFFGWLHLVLAIIANIIAIVALILTMIVFFKGK